MGEEEVYRAVFDADADDLIKESNRAQASLKKLTKTFSAVGTQMIKWGTIATVAIGGVIAQSLKAAASVEEMQSRFRITFKDMAKQTEAWSADYAAQIGRSRFAMMAMAADFKVLLTAFGLQQIEAVEASKALTTLATDWESFRDIPIATVLTKIRSGLAGEAEGLRALGVEVTATEVKQKALTLGLVEQGQEVDKLTKVKARLAIILGGIKEAQGDAARTALDLTNQWRALSGALEELNVDFGQVFVEDAKSAIHELAKLVRGTSKWIRENKEAIRTIGTLALKISAAVVALGVAAKALVLTVSTATAASIAISKLGAIAATIASSTGGLGLLLAAAAALGLVVFKLQLRLSKWVAQLIVSKVFTQDAADAADELSDAIDDVGEAYERAAIGAAKLHKEVETRVAKIEADAVKSAWEAANDELAGHAENLSEIEERLDGMIARWESLDQAQAQFSAGVDELLFEMSLGRMSEAEAALERYQHIQQQIGQQLGEVKEGSVEAFGKIQSLLGQVTSGAEKFAEAMAPDIPLTWEEQIREGLGEGVAVGKAISQIEEFIKSVQAAVEIGSEIAKDTISDNIAELDKQLDAVDARLVELQDEMEGLKLTFDTTEAHRALDELFRRLGEFRAGVGAPAGPGLGTPTLDRLSTAMHTQRGRSGGNVVNVGGIHLRHAEPPRATAKLVAAEIHRQRRRTWGGRS